MTGFFRLVDLSFWSFVQDFKSAAAFLQLPALPLPTTFVFQYFYFGHCQNMVYVFQLSW